VLKKIKNIFKIFLFNSGWIVKKKYKNKTYTNKEPTLEIIEQILKSNGIIHMGAHRGTEAPVYDWFNKKTIWIEADPKVYLDLQINISQFINQKAFNNLLYDKDNEKIEFFISDNDGASSSIFKPGKDSQNIKMNEKKLLHTITLDSLLKKNNISPEDYNFWVMDLQGAELLALNGAKHSLKYCKTILIEISKEEQYINGAKWEDIKKILNEFNFKNKKEPTSSHEDVLFIKQI